MLSFSINPKLDAKYLSSLNVNMNSELARKHVGLVFEKAITNEVTYSVNVEAYGYGVETNEIKNKKKKEVQIVSQSDKDNGAVGVLESTFSYVDDAIDSIADANEYIFHRNSFKDSREYIMDEKGVDILVVIQKAFGGNQRAIEKLRKLKDEFSLDAMLHAILKNPKGYSDLCALESR